MYRRTGPHAEYAGTAEQRNPPQNQCSWNLPLVRRLIEKVIVYEDKFTVEFKSGVAVDVNA